MKKFYGHGIPNLDAGELRGHLIVVEGADGAGRSTQVQLLRDWLERLGYPTIETGLKRSGLVGAELQEAMQGNVLCPMTLSLFYATDLADQIESNIVSALRAGFVVVADRYIYTLMARDIVRGASTQWLKKVFGFALVPDVVVYLKVRPTTLAERSFQKDGQLDYWESGMDIQRSGDMYQCFVRYQNRIARAYARLSKEYDFEMVDGGKDPLEIHRHIRELVRPVVTSSAPRGVEGRPAYVARDRE
jgi:dTMP kinase